MGEILSMDLKKPMEPIKNVKFLNSDIFDNKTEDKINSFFKVKLDVVISDMAADTTGNKSLDSIRTNQLCTEALVLSLKNTKLQRGVFVSKLFMGNDFVVEKLAKSLFKKCKKFFQA